MRLLARALAVLVAGLVGLGVGVLGAFVQSMSAHVLGVRLPYGLLPALAGLGAVLVLTGVVLRQRLPVLAPALGWAVAVFSLAVPRPEGDLVVAGSVSGYLYLLGGALLIGVCLTFPYGGPPSPRPVDHRTSRLLSAQPRPSR